MSRLVFRWRVAVVIVLACAGACDDGDDEGPIVTKTTVSNRPVLPTPPPAPKPKAVDAGAGVSAPAASAPPAASPTPATAAPLSPLSLFRKGLQNVVGRSYWLDDDVLVVGQKNGVLKIDLKAGQMTRLPMKGEVKAAGSDVVVSVFYRDVSIHRVSTGATIVHKVPYLRAAVVLGGGARVALHYAGDKQTQWVVVDTTTGAIVASEAKRSLKVLATAPDGSGALLFAEQRGSKQHEFHWWDDGKLTLEQVTLRPDQWFAFGVVFHPDGDRVAVGNSGHIDTYAMPGWAFQDGRMPTTSTGDKRRHWRPLGFRDRDWIWVESDRAVSIAQLGGKILSPLTVDPDPKIRHKTAAGDGSVVVISGALSGALVAVRVGADGKLAPRALSRPSPEATRVKQLKLSRTGRWLALDLDKGLQVVDMEANTVVTWPAQPPPAGEPTSTIAAFKPEPPPPPVEPPPPPVTCKSARKCEALATKEREAGNLARAGEAQARLCRFKKLDGCRRAVEDYLNAQQADKALAVLAELCRRKKNDDDCSTRPADIAKDLHYKPISFGPYTYKRELCSKSVLRQWKKLKTHCAWRGIEDRKTRTWRGERVGFVIDRVPKTLKKHFALQKGEVILAGKELTTGDRCEAGRIASWLKQQCAAATKHNKKGVEFVRRNGVFSVKVQLGDATLTKPRQLGYEPGMGR